MPRRTRNGAAPLGSKRARQIAVAILEALSGERSTTEAAAQLGVSMSRYYQLEARALVRLVLATLMAVLGAPLVLKHDNGGAFVADVVAALLRDRHVVSLRSPPYRPQYNGGCERGGGSLKGRTAHLAAARGHPDRWTEQDLVDAMHQANTTARPRGPNGLTPAEALAARRLVTPAERRAFERTRRRAVARLCKTYEEQRGTMPACAARAAILRNATQHALCAHGCLEFRRGRISTPISTWRADIKA